MPSGLVVSVSRGVTDITQHRTHEGWPSRSVVLDAFLPPSGRWLLADHLRTELVVDGLDMA